MWQEILEFDILPRNLKKGLKVQREIMLFIGKPMGIWHFAKKPWKKFKGPSDFDFIGFDYWKE